MARLISRRQALQGSAALLAGLSALPGLRHAAFAAESAAGGILVILHLRGHQLAG